MKNKKVIIYILVIIIILFLISILIINSIKKRNNHLKFKTEYESLNNKTAFKDTKYREITIPKDNPFIYSSMEEVIDKMDKKQTFIVYFGANWCPWCRSVINTFIDISKENNIDKVYYIDVRKDNNMDNEIRNVYSLDNRSNIYLSHKGTEAYNKFIDRASDILPAYSHGDVKSLEGTKYQGEKRVGAPNFIIIKKGEPTYMTTGISKKQTEPTMKLTKEIKKDTENKFKKFYKIYKK